jgi:DNA recombination protein RmuC
MLGAVKTEFAKFGDSLDVVSKKLEEASNKMSETTRRSRAVERKLREVEALPDDRTAELLLSLGAQQPDDEPPVKTNGLE